MARIRLRTKFLLSLIFTIAVLTGTVLLIVQNYLRSHARQEIYEALHNSVLTFQQFESQRQRGLAQSAALLADLPNLRALMTTQHAPTIRDASTDLWHLTESDLFLLADRSGNVMALHTTAPGYTIDAAQASLSNSLANGEERDWWFAGNHLFAVFLQPIYFGDPRDNVVLGVLALGFQVDQRLAETVSRVASCQVAFRYGNQVVVTTLSPGQQRILAGPVAASQGKDTQEVDLGGEVYLATSLQLAPAGNQPVTLTVLKSFDEATQFLHQLNRMLLLVGLIAVLAGSWLIYLISHTLTQPLASLASGVRALELGDFNFPLHVRSGDEIGDLTQVFGNMRKTLQKTQNELLHAERLATIGRMASTISHDLRHPLTTILAYAEFQSEANIDSSQRKTLYDEIRAAVTRMAELISSLLEFSKGQEAMKLVYGDLNRALDESINAMRLRREFKEILITFEQEGTASGWFDFKKLDRAFCNLLQNACEAAGTPSGKVQVATHAAETKVDILFTDNGPGIPEDIREEIFHPFVTHGKDGGIGLGLTVVRKIARDHGGEVTIDSTGPSGTTFRMILPFHHATQFLEIPARDVSS